MLGNDLGDDQITRDEENQNDWPAVTGHISNKIGELLADNSPWLKPEDKLNYYE